MTDYPIASVSEPYNPASDGPSLDCCDEATKAFLQKNHDKWTMEQMEAIENYIMFKRRKLREASEKECTIEDFEKAKKDIDDDNEEGE